MMYDDGSYDVVDNSGTSYAFDTSGAAVSAVTASGQFFAGDYREQAKLSQFYPNNGVPWYENLAKYGATRAIDAHFATPAVNKTATGATYAGQNGKTYAGGNDRQVDPGNDGMMLLMLAGIAFLALS